MAYFAPPPFAHGDYPTSANLTIFSDGLNAIYNAIDGKSVVFLARGRETSDASSFYAIAHVHRWLFYTGEGTITNMTQSETTSLPDAGGTNVFDLDTVDWLTYGMIYRATGINFAIEDWTP